jgi:two-component system, OmpR family, sensor histidine kinase CiaH
VTGTRGETTVDAPLIRRVRLQLVGWSGAAILVVLVLLGTALYLAVDASLRAAGTQQLRQRAETVVDVVRDPGRGPGQARLGPVLAGEGSGTFALLVTPRGLAVFPREIGLPEGLPDAVGVREARAGDVAIHERTLGETPVRVLSRPIDVLDGRYVIQVVQDRTAEARTLDVLLAVLLGGGLLALLASLGAGAVYAGRALVPIRDALRRQREFAADASHELRTPITVVRGNLELLRRRTQADPETRAMVDDMDAELARLTSLVGDLLLLARSDSGAVQMSRERVDLADLALDAIPGLAGVGERSGVRVELDAAPTPVFGDAVRLRQLVTILVDNAVRHSPAGGCVTVRVLPSPEGAVLEVDDDGPGVRPEDAPHIFERFWRSPVAPPGGTGLGLAIAAWIVEHHGGGIDVGRAPGRGARFRVRLPLAGTASRRVTAPV